MTHQLWMTLIKNNLSPNQVYFLDCCRQKIKPTGIINAEAEALICQSKGLIDDEGKLSHKAQEILNDFETYLVKTKKKVATSVLGDNFLEKIKEYRELFPAIKLPSGELARQSVQELKDKFIWFFKTYPEYDWDLVLDATDFYIFNKHKENYSFMVTSSYLIQKTDLKTKLSRSILADYCQMILDNPDILKSI